MILPGLSFLQDFEEMFSRQNGSKTSNYNYVLQILKKKPLYAKSEVTFGSCVFSSNWSLLRYQSQSRQA